MKVKKILIAALSFGLIFGAPSTVSFAAINQVTQEERDEFNRRRNYQEIELLKTRVNESKKILDEKKAEYSLLEESLKAKQELLEKLTLENQGKNDNINDDLDSQISQLGYDIEVLQKSLEHKEKQVEYLEKEHFRIDMLQQDYILTTKVNPFLLDKADAKYEIRGYGAKGIIDPNEQNDYVKTVDHFINSKEELDKLLAEVREKVAKSTKQDSENPQQPDDNKEEQTTPKEALDEEIDLKESPSDNENPDSSNTNPTEDMTTPTDKEDENSKEELSPQPDQDLQKEKDTDSEETSLDNPKVDIPETPDSQKEDNELKEDGQSSDSSKETPATNEQIDKENQSEDNVKSENDNNTNDKETENPNEGSLDSDKQPSSLEEKDKGVDLENKPSEEEIEKQKESDNSKEKTLETPDENNEKPKEDTKSPDPNQQTPPSDELAEKEKSTDLKDKPSNADEKSEDTNENQSKPQTEENPSSKEIPAKDLPATKVIDKQPTKAKEDKKINPAGIYKILESIYPIRIITPSGKDYTTTIKIEKENPHVNKDIILVTEDLTYINKGSHKRSDLEAQKVRLEQAIKDNKDTVRAVEILEEITPNTVAKNRAKINKLLTTSQRLIKEATYALAEYNYLLSK